ncbi:MAG: serine acetyltransferase [Bacteroidaceae bacterium]|nr:serine acetyltransferase [Bacteroidaceae bacterium]
MKSTDFARLYSDVVDQLSDYTEMKQQGFFHECHNSDQIPSAQALREIRDLCRALIFPGFYGRPDVNCHTLKYTIGVEVERLYTLLVKQIAASLSFTCKTGVTAIQYKQKAEGIATHIVESLPLLRRTLETDVRAAYNGDPAATDISEVISCYPVIKTLINYRVAHELYLQQVPLLPRMLTEMAHNETGIDIHPAASIGHHFTIDHGTGVVIGATCIIGNNVKLYQGVTLGARSFPLDEEGHPIKGIARHPILEDDVIVYSNATILGRITIGKGAVIGGNIWVTEDVPPGAHIVQYRTPNPS